MSEGEIFWYFFEIFLCLNHVKYVPLYRNLYEKSIVKRLRKGKSQLDASLIHY